MLVAYCYEVNKAVTLAIMFSAVTGKLNWSLPQVQKRNTEKPLYLVSRPSLSGKGNKHRTLKRCSIKPWNSKHLLPSKSTSLVELYQLEKKDIYIYNLSENSTWTVRTPAADSLFWVEIHLSYQILSGTLRLKRSKVKACKSLEPIQLSCSLWALPSSLFI